MKRLIRIILAILIAAPLLAKAQTGIALTTSDPSPFTATEPMGCNIANTLCRYTDETTHAMQIVVTLQPKFGLTVNGAVYTVTQGVATLLVDTNYRKVFDLEYTLAPTDVTDDLNALAVGVGLE